VDVQSLADIIGRIWSIVFGLAFAGGFLALVWTRAAERWRRLAKAYPAPQRASPRRVLRFETLILHEGGMGFNSYRHIVTARLYETGVELSLLSPFSIAHPPVFIPYSDAKVETYPWYAIGEAFEIKTLRAPQITIVIHENLADAIAGDQTQMTANA